MTTAVTDLLDLSFLSVVEDGPDDFVVGNGQTFINVPAIAVTVISMLDGTRTVGDVREQVLQPEGVDIDVADFVSGLDSVGLLTPPVPAPNLWDRIGSRHASWLFSWVANGFIALLVAAAVAVVVIRPGLAPFRYLAIADSSSSFTFIVAFAIISWITVFIHEFSHILAARSLDVHAELSFGTRAQFLVAQTNVTGIWRVPVRRRYRVYLAGMRIDLALLSAATCVLPFIHYSQLLSLVRVITLIWLEQIVWQFLFFMRTDVYYAYANLTRNKNLMQDATSYLRSVLRRRPHAAPRGIRAYARFLVVGHLLGFIYFVGFTIPVSIVLCRDAAHQLAYSAGFWGKAEGLLALVIMAAAWSLFAFLVLRSWHRRRTTAPKEGTP